MWSFLQGVTSEQRERRNTKVCTSFVFNAATFDGRPHYPDFAVLYVGRVPRPDQLNAENGEPGGPPY